MRISADRYYQDQQRLDLQRQHDQRCQELASERRHVQELEQARILRARRLQSGLGQNVDTYA